MGYWIFKANPKYYDIDRRLAHPKTEITWQATQHRSEMQVDDIAFIYRTGKDPGVVGLLRLTDTPSEFTETEFERDFDMEFSKEKLSGPQWFVNCEITARFPAITKGQLLALPAIQNRANVLDRQGTNFPLSPEEATAISSLCTSMN